MFVVLEGVNGSGKSTQVKRLKSYFEGFGREVVIVREPGGTEFGEDLRKILKFSSYEYSQDSALLVFMACRVELYNKVVKPALERKAVVIADRWTASTLVYQWDGNIDKRLVISKINQFFMDDIKPDYQFFLDVSAEESVLRRQKMAGDVSDKFESRGLDYIEKLCEKYQKVAKLLSMIYINGSRDENIVFESIKQDLLLFQV